MLALEKAKVTYDLTVHSIKVSAEGSTSDLTELNYQTKLINALRTYSAAREALELLDGGDFDAKEYQQLKKNLAAAEEAYYSYDGGDAAVETSLWNAYDAALDSYQDVADNYAGYSSAMTKVENAYENLESVRQQYEIYQSQITPEDTTSNDLKLRQAELTYSRPRMR